MRLSMSRPLALFVLAPVMIAGAQSSAISIIPRPVSLQPGRSEFTLTARTIILADRADSSVAQRFARSLAEPTGFTLAVRIGANAAGSRIVFRRSAARDTTLGSEGYRLEVNRALSRSRHRRRRGGSYPRRRCAQPFPRNTIPPPRPATPPGKRP